MLPELTKTYRMGLYYGMDSCSLLNREEAYSFVIEPRKHC
jgi:hypothetical protein